MKYIQNNTIILDLQLDGSTHPCTTDQCGGGVGRNIAEALWKLRGGRAKLITAVGDDADGQYLADIAPGLIVDGCIVKNSRTPTYAAVLSSAGECLLGLGDMGLHNHITVDLVNKHMKVLEAAPIVVIDGNLPQATINHVLRVCHRMRKPVFYESTDRRKATKILQKKQGIVYSSPNLSELRAMAKHLSPDVAIKESSMDLNDILQIAKVVTKVIDYLILTIGERGIITVNNIGLSEKYSSLVAKVYPVEVLSNIENVSGAGDCFSSGFIQGMLLGYKESICVNLGYKTAQQTLLCKGTVPSTLNLPMKQEKAKYTAYKIII